jgi:hypothetical protein
MRMHVITIMADYGSGPYAWQKPFGDASAWVGGNVADATSGFPAEFGIPPEIESEFAAWVTKFERDATNETFAWAAFHAEGISLAQRLRDALDPSFEVVYRKPCEDPTAGRNERNTVLQRSA